MFSFSDLNICSDGDNKFTTPLQMAARFNSPATARLLILNAADVAKQSNYGQQALHYAARRGNLKVVEVGTLWLQVSSLSWGGGDGGKERVGTDHDKPTKTCIVLLCVDKCFITICTLYILLSSLIVSF